MADDLKIPVSAPGAKQTEQQLRGVADAEQKIGRAGAEGGKQAAQGMSVAASATQGFVRQIAALGASYVGLQKLLQTITEIIAAYNQAIELQGKFTRTGIEMGGSLAGAAAQFSVSESAMRRLAGGIAVEAGGGPQDMAAMGSLLTAAASAGLVSSIKPAEGGKAATMAGPERAMIARMYEFLLQRGATGEAQGMAKLLAKGMKGMPQTEESMLLRLSQIHEAYSKSELADWGDFLRGAISGTAGLLEEGVGFETAISQYGGLAKMKKSGMAAGETFRMLGEQLFVADRPEIVQWIGPERYWRLKKENPDALFRLIMTGLMQPEGAERAKLMKRLKIAPELGGRISAMRGSRGEQAAIERAMQGATTGAMTERLTQWRTSPRAEVQRGDLGVKLFEAEAGGSGFLERVKVFAEAYQERLQQEEPVTQWISEVLHLKHEERRRALMLAIEREYKRLGRDPGHVMMYEPVFSGTELKWSLRGDRFGLDKDLSHEEFLQEIPHAREAMRGLGLGVNYQGGTHHHYDERRDPAGRPLPARGR